MEPAAPVTDDTPVVAAAVLASEDELEPVAVVLNDAAQLAELGSVTPSLRCHALVKPSRYILHFYQLSTASRLTLGKTDQRIVWSLLKV